MLKVLTLFLSFLILAGAETFAAEELVGNLAGQVIDKDTQQPLPCVNVVVVGKRRGASTDMKGNFEIKGLPAGIYNLQFSIIGYRTLVKSRVVVNPGRTTFLTVELEVEPVRMESIVARPSFFEKTRDAVVSSRRMDFAEIRSQPGGCYDVQRAVQALPAVVSGTDQDNEVIVRGGNYGENLFVVDNIEIANPNHFAWQGTGGGPVNMLNVDFIRQVDFIAGAFPAKYGDRASSVMDIKLREGNSQGFLLKLGMSMAGAGGSIEGPINRGKGSYMASFYRSFLSLIKSGFGMTAVPHYQDFQTKIVYNISDKHKLIVNGMFGNDWIYIAHESTGYHTGGDIDVEAKTHQYAVGATLKSLWNQNSYSLLTLYRTLNHWHHYVTNIQKQEVYHNYSTEAENGVKFDYTNKFHPQNELSTGFYLKPLQIDESRWSKPDTLFYYNYDNSGTVTDSTVVLNPATGQPYVYEVNVKKRADSYKCGFYLQHKYSLSRPWILITGLRYDYFAYTRRGYWSPRLGVSWHLTPSTSVNLAYGRCYQSPQYYELTLDNRNHYLKSKYTDQVVLGLEHLFAEDLKGTVETYYKRYRDVPIPKAYTTPDPNDWDGVMLNKGRGYAKGIEFFLQKKVKKQIWGTLSYSHSIARAEDPRYPGREYSWDFDFRNVFTLIVGYRKDLRSLPWYMSIKQSRWYRFLSGLPFTPADEVELSVRCRYTGGRPYTPSTWHPEWKRWRLDETQYINSKRFPSYKRIDVLLERRWFFRGWNMTSYIEIENIFNQKNIWDYQYNNDGSRDTIYQFGRMIIGGVTLEL